MISVEEALSLVERNLPKPAYLELSLSDSLGLVLAHDVISPIAMPPFRQSAMDGYALNIGDRLEYEIIGEIKAGDSHNPALNPGQGVRIFTGAAVPDSANTVMMQEHVEVEDSGIRVMNQPKNNQNIRPEGEQISAGELALEKGSVLNPSAIGFLVGLGITRVVVNQNPSIAIIVTGSELVEPGKALSRGEIYESNGIMLASALKNSRYTDIEVFKVDDDYQSTLSLLGRTLKQFDLVLISGGISVGDYDFTGKALKELGVNEVFYKVNQKPGKPLFFGRSDNTTVFALPGNPASALICFYIYVLPALDQISGKPFTSLPRRIAKSRSSFSWKGGRAQFLKAEFNNGEVEILEGQSSAMLSTFARANALVYISENGSSISQGDELEILCLPNN